MPNERTDETLSEIRRVALKRFASDGYDAASIREIAAEVGIKGASMYHHFSSKEEILWDLTQLALAELDRAWREAREAAVSDDAESLLRVFVRSDVTYHALNRTNAMLVNSQLHRLSPEHFDAAAKQRRQYEQELTTIVRACVATGRHETPNERVTVYAILQMIAAISGWYDPNGPLSVVELAETYEELALKLLAPTSVASRR